MKKTKEERKFKQLCEVVETYINGNHSDFATWVKRASKADILHIIEVFIGQYGRPRHEIITQMRLILDK